jgi:GINS complex protein
MGYFDLDDIFMEEERVPVITRSPGYQLGHLDPTSGSPHIEEGQRLELPLWLSERLQEDEIKPHILIHMPPLYSQESLMSIRADPDPSFVKLRMKNPNFYQFGLKLTNLVHDESSTRLASSLKDIYAKRIVKIMISGSNSINKDVNDYVNGLTVQEKKIFWSCYANTRVRLAWNKRLMEQITTSNNSMKHLASMDLSIGSSSTSSISVSNPSKKRHFSTL